MNDPDHKTIPDVPAGGTGSAQPSDAPVSKDALPSAREPFDPFKFQSITMPPGLRGELIEEARNRPSEGTPEVTTPPVEQASHRDPPAPKNGPAGDSAAGDEAATIRIAKKLDTERLPRVVLARAQERRRRLAIAVVGALAGFAGFAAVWSQREPDRVESTRPPEPTEPPAAAVNAAPAAQPSLPAPPAVVREVTPPATPDVVATTPTPAPHVAQPPLPKARPSRERSTAPREPAPSKPSSTASSVPKPAASHPNGVDLLDFEGPAPKGP